MHSKIPLYKEYHGDTTRGVDRGKPMCNTYPGNSYHRNHKRILSLMTEYKCNSALDYGCGKGEQYFISNRHKDFGFMPTLYDPAVEPFSELPTEKFDIVYSTDVFEHIPESEIPGALHWIFLHAKKVVYLAICNVPAKAVLPNGENAHCTVRPHNWWRMQIMKHGHKQVPCMLFTYPEDSQHEMIMPDRTPVTEFLDRVYDNDKTE